MAADDYGSFISEKSDRRNERRAATTGWGGISALKNALTAAVC